MVYRVFTVKFGIYFSKRKLWSSYKDAIKPYLSASIWRPFNKKKSQTQKISCSSIANICLDFWGQDRTKLNCFHGMCVLWFTSTPTPLSGLVWWFLLSLFLPALTVLRAPHLVPVQPFWQLCLRHLHVPSAGSDSRTLTETLTAALWPLTTKDVTWFHCQLRWVPDFTALMRQFSRPSQASFQQPISRPFGLTGSSALKGVSEPLHRHHGWTSQPRRSCGETLTSLGAKKIREMSTIFFRWEAFSAVIKKQSEQPAGCFIAPPLGGGFRSRWSMGAHTVI